MSENGNKSSLWSQQNIIVIVLLVVVIVLLAANLFKSPPSVQVVDNSADEAPRRDKTDRGRDEDPYIANQVKNTLLKGYVKIRDCYNAFVDKKPPVTDGIIMIDWTIQPDGDVKKAELVSSELNNDDLAACMIKEIEGFTFPPPPNGKPKYVAHKYRFKKE